MSGKGEDPWTQTPIHPPLPHQFKSVLHAPQLPLTKLKIDFAILDIHQQQDPAIASVIKLAELLETCNFLEAWVGSCLLFC